MYVNYLAPVTDKKKPAVWAATPRKAVWIIVFKVKPFRLQQQVL